MSKVTLYALKSCAPCGELKSMLDDLEIQYDAVYIDHDLDNYEYKDILEVPFLKIVKDDGTEVHHYGTLSKNHLNKLLNE